MNRERDDWEFIMPLKMNSQTRNRGGGGVENQQNADLSVESNTEEDDIGIITFIGACGGVLSKELPPKMDSKWMPNDNLEWQMNLQSTDCVATCISTPQMKVPQSVLNSMPSPLQGLSDYQVPIRRFSIVANSSISSRPYKIGEQHYLTCSPTSKMDVKPAAAGTLPMEDDDSNYRGGGGGVGVGGVGVGILPTARARLASLKSLGTKKFNALKLRLSDIRQKELAGCEYSSSYSSPSSPFFLYNVSNELLVSY